MQENNPTELTLQTISKEKQLQTKGVGWGWCVCVCGQSKVTDGRKRKRIDPLHVSRQAQRSMPAADESTVLFPLNAGKGCRLTPSRHPPSPSQLRPPLSSVQRNMRRSDGNRCCSFISCHDDSISAALTPREEPLSFLSLCACT